MIRIGIVILTGLVLCFGLSFDAAAEPLDVGRRDKLVLGWLENIVLKPWNLVLRAKLDSGANTASIDAENITFFEKERQNWVRFAYIENKRNTRPKRRIVIERPLLRIEQIKEHFGKPQQRPVVTLQFCLHGKLFETEFNLVDRSHFNYPVLLGRRFLKKIAVVDPEVTQSIRSIPEDCTATEARVDANYEKPKGENDP
ncbi:MAG: ATP-dependent zinc protease family protein [Gammaproteobacteria bacterium]